LPRAISAALPHTDCRRRGLRVRPSGRLRLPRLRATTPCRDGRRARSAALPTPDLHRAIASLSQSRAALELGPTDLCFLVALDHRAKEEALASLEEEVLVDVFLRVCEVTEPGAENPRKRATHALQRLVDQRLVSRVDGVGLRGAREYALTSLGAAIGGFFLADETLTRESLALLTKLVVSQLAATRDAARVARTPEEWRRGVIEPLRVTVSELVHGIERRQRGMDAQQQEVRARIEELLHKEWFAAVGACEALLDETATTLRELHEVLLQDAGHLQAVLGDVAQLAASAAAPEAEEAAQRVSDQVDRVSAWGTERQRAWSDYYQYIQRYLRDVVRLDPDRAVSHRLREQLAGFVDRPFSLIMAGEPSILLLRDLSARVERPDVRRPRADRDRSLTDIPPDGGPTLEELVRAQLDDGACGLAELLRRILPRFPDVEQYRTAGRVMEFVVGEALVTSERERAWKAASGGLEVEEWMLARRPR
jgi:chromosome partition protein MukF